MKIRAVLWVIGGLLFSLGCGGGGGGGGGAQPGTLQAGAAAYSVGEAAGTATITVTRVGGTSGAASVSYTTGGGTATAGADYMATSGTLAWADGDAAPKTFTVTILDDATDEPDETVIVTLSGSSGASLGSPSSATLTIADDDEGPVLNSGTLQLSAVAYSAGEADGAATITVTRVAGASGAAYVSYATGGGTATAGADYMATSGALAWADGDAAPKTFTVTIFDDATDEPDETVIVALSGASGAILGSPSSATLLIADDDGLVLLTGTIRAAEHVTVDGDTNDPNMPYVANDDFARAQAIPNPVTLAGYANNPGNGPAGPSQVSGDVSDFYRISLAAGQTIRLRIAEPTAGDLDLALYDADQNFVDASLGIGRDEALTVADAGTYFVEVFVFSGASGYVLAAGLTPEAAVGPGVFRLSDEFVPGDVIARFRPAVLPASEADTIEAWASTVGLVAKAGAPDRECLLSLGGPSDRSNAFRYLGLPEADPMAERLAATDLETREKWATLRAIKALNQRFDIIYAEPNHILRHLSTTPNDQHFPSQWHYPMINLPQAWDITRGQQREVVVAVVDTGVLLAHPDLQGQLTSDGYDFIRDPAMAADGDGIDANPNDPGDASWPGEGSSFHGTHVAGTIAARSNNNIGVTGVSWFARVLPIRVLGRGGGADYDVLQGVRYAAGLPNDSGRVPARRADVINLSLGGPSPLQAAQEVYSAVRNAGSIIIAAAGNNATREPMYPASYDGVVSVSSVDLRKQLARYSNFGQYVDVAAPGGDTSKDLDGDGYSDGVLSTWGTDSGGSVEMVYYHMQGTSMASPHVAGVVALMKAVNPSLTAGQFDALLAGGTITEDIGATGRDDQFGHGLIDAHRAVVEAQRLGSTPTPSNPTLVATPASLNLGAGSTSADFTLLNGGGGSLTVSALSCDQPWATVRPKNIDAATGLGSYTVTVDRNGLAEGTHTARLSIASSANSLTVTLILQSISGGGAGGDAGFHYVLLLDPVTLTTLDQVEVPMSGGAYAYSFVGVPTGEYQVWAGTDLDNDGIICDDGEACGAYLTVTSPTNIVADRHRTGLDFGTGFDLTLTSQGARENMDPGRAGIRRLSAKRLGR